MERDALISQMYGGQCVERSEMPPLYAAQSRQQGTTCATRFPPDHGRRPRATLPKRSLYGWKHRQYSCFVIESSRQHDRIKPINPAAWRRSDGVNTFSARTSICTATHSVYQHREGDAMSGVGRLPSGVIHFHAAISYGVMGE